MSELSVLVIAIVAPVAVLILVGRILKHRRVQRQSQFETNTPLQPAIEAAPGFLLRHFMPGELEHLRSMRGLAWFGMGFTAYVVFIALSLSLLPDSVQDWLRFGVARAPWLSLCASLQSTKYLALFLALIAAFITYAPELTAQHAIFTRTRPVTLRFLFFSRVLFALISQLAGLALGYGLALLLTVLTRGPVWSMRAPGETTPLAAFAQTAALAIATSCLVTLLLALQRRPLVRRKGFSLMYFVVYMVVFTFVKHIFLKPHRSLSTIDFLLAPSVRTPLLLLSALLFCAVSLLITCRLFATYEP